MKIFKNIKVNFDDNLQACGWYFSHGNDKYTHGFEVKKEITPDKQIQVIEDMLTSMRGVISLDKCENCPYKQITESLKKLWGDPIK